MSLTFILVLMHEIDNNMKSRKLILLFGTSILRLKINFPDIYFSAYARYFVFIELHANYCALCTSLQVKIHGLQNNDGI